MSQPSTAPWRYAVGMFGTSLPINMVRGSIILFYVDILGLDTRTYGVVMVVYAIIDAIDNPLFGYLSDRTRSPFGRRKPWLAVATPLLTACFIALFWVPSWADGVLLVAWFAVFAILTEAFDSMINANYGALLPELFPAEKRRALANALRQGFQLVAMVISVALTPTLTTSWFGTETTSEGFTITAFIYGVVAFAVILFMTLGVREDPRAQATPQAPLWGSIKAIGTTREFWIIGAIMAGYSGGMALVLSGLQLFVRYSLEVPVALATPILAAVIITAVAVLPLWMRLIVRLGALVVWRWALTWLACAFLPMFFITEVWQAVIAGLVVGVGYSGVLATMDLVIARVLDRDAAQYGVRREGIFLSAFGFFTRLSGALSGLALASLGWIFGYYSGEDPGDQPGTAFRVFIGVFPVILIGSAAVLSRLVRVEITDKGK